MLLSQVERPRSHRVSGRAPVALAGLWCALLCALPACKDKPKRHTVERSVEAPAAAQTAEGSDAGPTRPEEPTYSPEEYATYKRHLHLGRAHADQRRYAEAVREFDEALDVLPMDGRALSELGWAAFQAGDWQRARTANQDAVRVARRPKVRAASLYNLGRLAEAQGDRTDAETRYRASLALRPNKDVEKRLAGLARRRPKPRPTTRSACPAAAELPALCACLANEPARGRSVVDPPGAGDAAAPPSCQSESRDVSGVKLLFVGDDADEWVHLIRRGAKGWSSIARLGRVHDSDTEGVHEEFEVARFENRQIGERRVLWIEIVQTRTDDEAQKRGLLAERTLRLVVCPWPTDGQEALVCALEVPISERHERVRRRTGKPADQARPYVRTVFSVSVDIGDDGRASVVLTAGKKTDELSPLLGEHKLW